MFGRGEEPLADKGLREVIAAETTARSWKA
jgi:hypothetical protein